MTARRLLSLVLLLCLGGLSGCANDCQKFCKEVADYWSDCGIS